MEGTATKEASMAEETTESTEQQMCCDGKKTAEEHRHEAEDGKCCSD